MKTTWTLFVGGFFFAALLSSFFVSSHAQEGDPRVSRVSTPEISALHTDVPEGNEVEASLARKKIELDDREKVLLELEEQLRVQEERVKARIEELQSLQAKQDAHTKANAEERKVVEERLVKTYETMAPKKAAEVIAVMDDKLAVELMMRMKPKSVAAVLDKMDSNRAMMLSAKIADRRPAAAPANGGKTQP
jgi:flagellar motility protein MotE (MotC chaperone)